MANSLGLDNHSHPARDEAVQPITPERLAEVRERFNAIPHADPDSLTGHVKGMLALIDSLASAPAPASGVDAVAVKALEWRKIARGADVYEIADTGLNYSYHLIVDYRLGWKLSILGPIQTRHYKVDNFATEPLAKAAAQSDYEQRIRSALSPAATSGSEAGGEAVTAALEAADAVLTGEDACALDPIVGSDNPHEHAAGLVREALRVREATRPHPTDHGHWRWRGE